MQEHEFKEEGEQVWQTQSLEKKSTGDRYVELRNTKRRIFGAAMDYPMTSLLYQPGGPSSLMLL